MRRFSRRIRKHYPELAGFLARVRRKDLGALWFATAAEEACALEALRALGQDVLDAVYQVRRDVTLGSASRQALDRAAVRILRAIRTSQLDAFLLGVWLGQLETAGLRALVVKPTRVELLRPNPN